MQNKPATSAKPLAQKLLIKEGMVVLLINAPAGYPQQLTPLPKGAAITTTPAPGVDVIQAFVVNQKQLEQHLASVKSLADKKTLLWLCYPKGTSKKYKADINRDTIYPYAQTLGLEGVAMVSIDDDWSAMRFKLR